MGKLLPSLSLLLCAAVARAGGVPGHDPDAPRLGHDPDAPRASTGSPLRHVGPPPARRPGVARERLVLLRDGSVLHAYLIDSDEDGLSLSTRAGDVRRIAWSDVRRVLIPRPSAQPEAPPIARDAGGDEEDDEDTVRLSFRSDDERARLLRLTRIRVDRVGEHLLYRLACGADCDLLAREGDEFQVRGPGLAVRRFVLPAASDHVEALYHGGSRGLRGLGWTLFALGIPVGVFGPAVALVFVDGATSAPQELAGVFLPLIFGGSAIAIGLTLAIVYRDHLEVKADGEPVVAAGRLRLTPRGIVF